MEVLIEKVITYSVVILFIALIVFIYIRKQKRDSRIVDEKIKLSKEEGLHEPVSLHPVVDVNSCIRTGACISACPEKDILGIRNGKATIINASHCVGHGACFHACPVEAISLCIGTEKRGVDLPHVNQQFESNVPGIFIAGEIGGMGLIKNAVEQGRRLRVARRGLRNRPGQPEGSLHRILRGLRAGEQHVQLPNPWRNAASGWTGPISQPVLHRL